MCTLDLRVEVTKELLYSRLSLRVKLHRPLGALSAAPVADVFIGHDATAVLDDLSNGRWDAHDILNDADCGGAQGAQSRP